VDYRILGPLEVRDDEGQVVPLGGRQQRLVLTTFLFHPNEVVSVDRLIDVLWGERAPSSAVKSVQIQVSRLRSTLETNGATRVHSHPGGYLLEIAPGELDVERFNMLVEEGRRALAEGDPREAAETLREAEALWRGAPLGDFAYESFARDEIERLNELRLGATEDRIEADLALARHGELTPELRQLVARHPLRERLRAQLMLALHRSGRKAEALGVYDEARRRLAEELGLEPVVTVGEVPGVRNPITFSGTPATYELPPPGLDEHGEEIRAWLTQS
jgi:DNA-binding SARP family transcriptional activator